MTKKNSGRPEKLLSSSQTDPIVFIFGVDISCSSYWTGEVTGDGRKTLENQPGRKEGLHFRLSWPTLNPLAGTPATSFSVNQMIGFFLLTFSCN